jgi:hypothetical protein
MTFSTTGAWKIRFTSTSPNYSCVRAIERRALQSEAMGLCLGAACKLSFWSERLRKTRATIRAPKTALKLFVSVPRSSDLTSRSTQCHRFSSNCELCGLVIHAQHNFAEWLPFLHVLMGQRGFAQREYAVDDRFGLRGLNKIQ